jgi:hypothetical protein
MRLTAAPDVLVIPAGVFNVQDLPSPAFSVYEERMESWVKFDCQVEHYL